MACIRPRGARSTVTLHLYRAALPLPRCALARYAQALRRRPMRLDPVCAVLYRAALPLPRCALARYAQALRRRPMRLDPVCAVLYRAALPLPRCALARSAQALRRRAGGVWACWSFHRLARSARRLRAYGATAGLLLFRVKSLKHFVLPEIAASSVFGLFFVFYVAGSPGETRRR